MKGVPMWNREFFLKIKCPFKMNCWRCSYSAFLHDNKIYKNGTPPTRAELFMSGYATAKMAEIKQINGNGGKPVYGGMYAQVMPRPDGKFWCEGTHQFGYEHCEEFKKEKEKDRKRKQRDVDKADKFLYATGRVHIDKEIRINVSRQAKYKCLYCKRHNSELRVFNIGCHIDHIIPLALGGTNEESNLAFTCAQCNEAKATEIWQPGCRIGYYNKE